MAFSFLKRRKTPEEVVRTLQEDLEALSTATETAAASGRLDKIHEDVAKRVNQMKQFIWGDPEAKEAVVDPAQVAELGRAVESAEMIPALLTNLRNVQFEARKDIASIVRYLLHNDVHGFASTYMPAHTSVLYQCMDAYTYADVALVAGEILREALRWPSLAEALLIGPDGDISKPLEDLCTVHVQNPNFEVASDAFDTLTVLLTTHKPIVFRALDPTPSATGDPGSPARYAKFFAMYTTLLQSDNYVLKRQSLKLLSEFLLDRENFPIMMKYISDRNNLKIIMMTLRHKLPNVQFEAFHVFKVFVANPEKPPEIAEILAMNKARLIPFLRDFQNEKNDEQFIEEKAMLVETLSRLPDVSTDSPAGIHVHHHASSTFGSAGVTSAVASAAHAPAPASQ